ncbi:MAG: hypothetical protein ACI9BW_002377 [Gammaproteobacteria bacterium]|jgi:hypothetical protein
MNTTDNQSSNAKPWWGNFAIDVNDWLEKRIGPLHIHIERRRREWLVTVEHEEEGVAPISDALQNRFVFSETRGPLHLRPALADRLVITRLLSPVQIAAHESVTLYVSTPLMVRTSVNDPPVLLDERFVVRPSETWFGPSTCEGELCYASSTRARLEISELDVQADRAVTSVRIDNQGADPLVLERIALPAPHLKLFMTPGGALWTQDISYTRQTADDLAELVFEKIPLRHAPDSELVCEARVRAENRTLFRAFGAMFN